MKLDLQAEARYRKLLGKKIRTLRGTTSLKETAKALKMKEDTLDDIEHGRCKVRILTLEKICRHWETTAKDITEDIMPIDKLTIKPATKTKKK